jgi:hypothetical protein
MNRFVKRLGVETLEERLAPAAGGTGLSAQGRSAILTPGQLASANPGVAISSPTPTPSGNQTASGGPAQLQNLNDATLFYNSSLATLAPPLPLPSIPPSTLFPPLNVSAFGSLVQSAALSSLGTVNQGQPVSVSSLSAYITVLSAASASVPTTSFSPRVGFFSRYPSSEETPEELAMLVALDSVWAISDFNPVSQTAAWQGLRSLVSASQQSAQEQPTFP